MLTVAFECCRTVAFIAKVCYFIGKDVMLQGRCIFATHFPSTCNGVICARQPVYRRLSTKQQASVPFSVQVMTFNAQLVILIVNFLQCYQKEINLEHGNNCSDEVLPNSRPALSDQQSNERNPLSNWTQCVAKIQKSETCLRIPKPMATAK